MDRSPDTPNRQIQTSTQKEEPLPNGLEPGATRAVAAKERTEPQEGASEHVTVSKPRLATLQGLIDQTTSQHMLMEHSRGYQCNGKARTMRDFLIGRRNYAARKARKPEIAGCCGIHLQTANARQGLG
jgi:hypothetical protein